MIPSGVEVFVATTPVDLRCGFDRLAGIASEHLGQNARSGALFVFFGKSRTSVKVLFADRTGLCIFYKRLGPWHLSHSRNTQARRNTRDTHRTRPR